MAVLKLRTQEQDTDGEHSGGGWVETGLAFTSRHGTTNELPTFTEFDRRISRAKVRQGELLGLTWEQVSPDNAELYVGEQFQRVGRQLLRRRTKTEGSEAPLPPPDVCVTALKLPRLQQDPDQANAADGWIDTGLVLTSSALEATAAHCCCTVRRRGRFQDRNRPLTCRYGAPLRNRTVDLLLTIERHSGL
ncbi:MAG TPA: hypothetical protein VF060_03465 [Trebonia sp.]